MKRLRIFTAKRKLYVALLELAPDECTEDDIRAMETLIADSEIQGFLQDALKLDRPNVSNEPRRGEGSN